ncbi:MAG: phosphocholine cytidylyltransferase family protein [Acidobacteria bacterium]|nr:phosphocholine cytidylyltransferase family protein [Acidobacteriota bacterium]
MRLRSVVDARPKGLIEIDGETLVGRSVRNLRDAGIDEVTIVAGYCADQYERFAARRPGVRIVLNERFATAGSMASLARALDPGDEAACDVLVLESDIVYEPRALTPILASSSPDATLLSGPTGAGDEVWVCAPEGRLETMSKRAADLPSIAGEFVGITRLSAPGAQLMLRAFAEFVAASGHERMDYETGALVAVGVTRAIATLLVPDLVWGEIDDERHFARVSRVVWPRLQVLRDAR